MFGSGLGNVVGTIYFICFQCAGILLAAKLLKEQKALTKVLLGSVFGSLMLQWIPVLLAFLFDFTLQTHVIALCLVLLLVFFGITGKWYKELQGLGKDIKEHKVFLTVLVVFMVFWGYLLHTHTIPVDANGAMHTGQCTYGDMNMHFSFITSIARQEVFPPDYSLFPGTRLAYPFLSDSISSSLLLMGASLRTAYILPMLFAMLQIFGTVYLMAMSLLPKKGRALLAWVFYFLNGGLGFAYFLNRSEGGLTFTDLFKGFYKTPTNLVDHNIRWVNVIADMFLPQRATLFGYAILFPAVWLLYQAVFKERKQYFIYAGVLAGALPLIHTHSFLGMGLISAAWLLLYLCRRQTKRDNVVTANLSGILFTAGIVLMCVLQILVQKEKISSQGIMTVGIVCIGLFALWGLLLLIVDLCRGNRKQILSGWGIYLLVVLVLALPQLLGWTFGQVAEGGFVRGHFNWGNLGEQYLWFYLKNIGLPLLLIVGAVFAKNRKYAEVLAPAGAIWLVAELILFTPNTYDNNKLLYIAYMLLCIAAADYGASLYERLKGFGGRSILAVLFLAGCVVSAILTLGREAVSDYELYGKEYVKLAEYVEGHSDASSVILTGTRHNNEIVSLTGRNIVCGSDVFLYYHGIHTGERREEVRLMYEMPEENEALFDKYHVEYVAITPYEMNEYAVKEEYFAQEWTLVYLDQQVALWKRY